MHGKLFFFGMANAAEMPPRCCRDAAGKGPGRGKKRGWPAKFLKITHHTGRDTAIEHQIRQNSGTILLCDFTVSHCVTVSLHPTASHCVTQRLKTSCLFLFDSRGQENMKRLYETFAYTNTTYRDQPGKPTAQAVGVCHVLT